MLRVGLCLGHEGCIGIGEANDLSGVHVGGCGFKQDGAGFQVRAVISNRGPVVPNPTDLRVDRDKQLLDRKLPLAKRLLDGGNPLSLHSEDATATNFDCG